MSTGNWLKLYESYYRKSIDYDMSWDISHTLMAAAPCSGPIAVYSRDLGELSIYSSSGEILASSFVSSVAGIGWIHDDQLVVLLHDGSATLWDAECNILSSFTMGAVYKTCPVADCVITDYGILTRSSPASSPGDSCVYHVVTSYSQPIVSYQLPAILDNHTQVPRCMALVPGNRLSTLNGLSIVIATASGPLLRFEGSHWEEILLSGGPFNSIAVSPSGGALALFSEDCFLHILHSTLDKTISDSAIDITTTPCEMVWCGDEAVVLMWEALLMVVGPYGDFISYDSADELLHLEAERDGVRVITKYTHEFLCKVPTCLVDVFALESSSPVAELYYAAEMMEQRDLRAYMTMRDTFSDKEVLSDAVYTCLDAATEETNLQTQANLLKAASFGKLYLEDFDMLELFSTCRKIRVMNTLRDYTVGIPLTPRQYDSLQPEGVVRRLLRRKKHGVALSTAEYLDMNVTPVLMDWACSIISNDTLQSDEELADTILRMFREYPGMSYAAIAGAAYKRSRPKLASVLLELEPKLGDQVPLLISMRMEKQALIKAVQSGDTDLVYQVLLGVLDRNRNELFSLISDRPVAKSLFLSYCRQHNRSLLKPFLYYLQDAGQAGRLTLQDAYEEIELGDRIGLIRKAQTFYEEKPELTFNSVMCDQQVILLNQQLELESQGMPCMDLSASQTIELLITYYLEQQAVKLKKKLKIPEARFMHIQVRALAKASRFTDLAVLVRGKKTTPIGWLPFVEACMEQNRPEEACTYIERLEEPSEKMTWYIKLGFVDKAAAVAIDTKDVEALHTIQGICKDNHVLHQIQTFLNTLPK